MVGDEDPIETFLGGHVNVNFNSHNEEPLDGLGGAFHSNDVNARQHENSVLIGVVVTIYMLMAVVINPTFWFLTLAGIANLWFIWAWVLGWYYITGSKQRFMWRVVVVTGLVFNSFALLAIVLAGRESGFAPWLWLSCLLSMQLMIMVIAFDARAKLRKA